MPKLLFVSIAFPPKNDPECLQTAKYFRYLAKDSRLSISVVTSPDHTLFMSYDSDLEKYNTGYVQKIELPIYEAKLSNFALRRIVPGGIDYPDSKYSFHLQKSKVVKKLIESPEIIYSRSNPLSSAFLAYKLKQHYNVPWIMHLSDPWVGSPVHPYAGRQLRFHQQWQDRCFASADYIALTSEKTIEFYTNQYPHYTDKFKFFPNVYDREDIVMTSAPPTQKLKIVYTGGLAGDRSAKNFIQACADLLAADSTIQDKLEVIFAGPLDAENRLVFEHTNSPVIKHIGNLTYSQALQLIRTADLLLTIDLPIANPAMAMFFPSKILDYFLAKRKIVALTTEGSATSAALQSTNSCILPHNGTEQIQQFIREAIEEHKKGNANFFTLEPIPEKYSAQVNADRLANLLCSC